MKRFSISLEALFICLCGLFIFCYGLFDHEFIQFEARFGLFAQEMLRYGPSFFPTTYYLPAPDYFATQTFLIYLLALLNGQLTILIAVLPSAIAASLILFFTYLIGATYSRSWGLYAVLLELTTYQFFAAARSINLDLFVAAITLICFYIVYSVRNDNRAKRIYWLLGLFFLSFLFQGFMGLLIPTSAVCLFYLLEKDFHQLARQGKLFILLLISTLCLTGIMAGSQGGLKLIKAVFDNQLFYHFTEYDNHAFNYFFNVLLYYAISFPLALLVFCLYHKALLHRAKQPEHHLLQHLTAWAIMMIIILSLSGTLRMRYVISITPAISLIAAYLFIDTKPSRWIQNIRIGITNCCYALPWLGLISIPASFIVTKLKGLTVNAHYLSAATLLTLAAIIVFFIKRKWQSKSFYHLSLFGIGTFVFWVTMVFIAEPINVSLNRAEPFVTAVEKQRTTRQALIFYKITPDAEAIKYMVTLNRPIQPLFASYPQQINHNFSAIIISKQTDFDDLPEPLRKQAKILYTGKLGHRECVAFTIAP